jgi:hypothetical protein
MKIDNVILSSNNSEYLDFWPIISKIWKTRFGIHPILFFIDDAEDLKTQVTCEFGTVFRINKLPNDLVALQTLWIRYYAACSIKGVNMISDIDMIPLSRKYFIDNVVSIPASRYVHINPCISSYGMLPSCYHICDNKLFSEILKMPAKWDDAFSMLISYFKKNFPETNGLPYGWFFDEKYSSDMILEFSKNNTSDVVFIPRDLGQNGRRIDRSYWAYEDSLVKEGYYYDCHSIRPYAKYSNEISKLIDTAFPSL